MSETTRIGNIFLLYRLEFFFIWYVLKKEKEKALKCRNLWSLQLMLDHLDLNKILCKSIASQHLIVMQIHSVTQTELLSPMTFG